MDEIICPNCGESNPADMFYCSSCQWRLRSLDGEWASGEAPEREGGALPSKHDGAADDALPDWLASLPTGPAAGLPDDEVAAAELRARLEFEEPGDATGPTPARGDAEDLLAGLAGRQQAEDEPIPEWVARIMGITDDAESQEASEAEGDWQQDATAASSSPHVGPASGVGHTQSVDSQAYAAPLKSEFTSKEDEPRVEDGAATPARESEEIYEWLRRLDADAAAPPPSTAGRNVPATADVPTWVGRMMGVTGESDVDAGAGDTSVPDWLRDKEANQASSTPIPSAVVSEPLPGEPPSEMAWQGQTEEEAGPPIPVIRDILKDIPSPEPEPPRPPAPATPGLDRITPAESSTSVPPEEQARLDVDEIFGAMELADWAAQPAPPGSQSARIEADAAPAEEPAAPAELPSWVEAMRPVESAVRPSHAETAGAGREAAGPLLGLDGVIPAIPGAGMPSGRPAAQAMKMDVPDRQRTQARLLEDLLEAESRPVPLAGGKRAGSRRLLNWLTSASLLAGLAFSVASGSTLFALPAAFPVEANSAVQVVQGLPPDSAILVVFDFEPATAGEMEASAAGLLDHLLLLQHPRLALISTNPTGSVLAERFVSQTLRERTYARGTQYLDLGYLPGGLSGVQYFAQNVRAAMPFGAAADPVWSSPLLANIDDLSDFQALIVLTDSVESGSRWIEQTTGHRGGAPMIIVGSAQSGPMLLPYFDAGQVQGLVAGLPGAASAENANGGRPGFVRRYWDAYNIGLYTAVLLIVIGAVWQIVRRLGRRRMESAL